MNIYLTKLTAVNQLTGELRTYAGPNIEAPTWKLAEQECAVNYPYLKVVGVLTAEIDAEDRCINYNHSSN